MLRAFLALFATLWAVLAFDHPANVASSQLKVGSDGVYSGRLRFDLAAFVTAARPRDADDKAMNAFLDAGDDAMKAQLAEAEGRFRAGFVTEPGGTIDRVVFPTVADIRRYLASNPDPRLPAMLNVEVEGHLPAGSRTVAFRYPSILDTVIQTVEFPYTEPISEPVEGGQASSTLKIPTADEVKRLADAMNAPRTSAPAVVVPAKPKTVVVKPVLPKKVVVSAKPIFGPPAPAKKVVVVHPAPVVPAAPVVVQPAPVVPAPVEAPRRSPVLTYLQMGFHHILPEGVDHILFVLGLFLLGSNLKALLKQITAFTVAHSITLALATLNIIRLPGSIIEPVIAASIAFVAIENLFMKDVKPWRTAVVFAFGLVHGMGFAEVFKDAGLSGGGLITALLSFNVGVELGQLTVVLGALLLVGWFRKNERYRQVVVIPFSLLIALVALFWTYQRIFA